MFFSGEERIRTSGTLAGPHDFQSESAVKEPREIEKPAVNDTSGSPEIDRLGAALGQSSGQSDEVERALSFALTEAAKAGRFDVVAQLARELEARRRARGS